MVKRVLRESREAVEKGGRAKRKSKREKVGEEKSLKLKAAGLIQVRGVYHRLMGIID